MEELKQIITRENFVHHVLLSFSLNGGSVLNQSIYISNCTELTSLGLIATPLLRPVLSIPTFTDMPYEYFEESQTHVLMYYTLQCNEYANAAEELKALFTLNEAKFIYDAFMSITSRTHNSFSSAVERILREGLKTEEELYYLVLAKLLKDYSRAYYLYDIDSTF